MGRNSQPLWIALDNRGNLDSAINLAIEEFAVRNLDEHRSYFFVYRNNPSVIIGKHQNVLLEVNLPFCWENNIPIYRRISGGGAVYHDPGNLNLSFITRYSLKQFNQYRTFLEPVVQFFKQQGIRLVLDQRNNLLLNNKKVSGNAQFTSRQRMLSHGTLLINSHLDVLRQTLKKPEEAQNVVQSHATQSIKSQVTNVADESGRTLNAEELSEPLTTLFCGNKPQVYGFSDQEWRQIRQLAERKYRSWEWNIAESPPAFIQKQAVIRGKRIKWEYFVEDGKFKKVCLYDQDFKLVESWFEGQRIDTGLWQRLKKEQAQLPLKRQSEIEELLRLWF